MEITREMIDAMMIAMDKKLLSRSSNVWQDACETARYLIAREILEAAFKAKKNKGAIMHHRLNIPNAHYEEILEGNKTFEVCYAGAVEYQKGDTVELIECKPGLITDQLTGRRHRVMISHVSYAYQRPDYVILGFGAGAHAPN